MDVLVIDKSIFPRDKTCAGWVTPAVMELLHIDLADYSRGRVLQPITGFCTGLIGGREIRTSYARVISFGIRRCEFDHYLLERSGARCQLGTSVTGLQRQADHWLVNGAIRARLLVGAGGHFCPVARWVGARRNRRATVVAAQEAEFRVGPGAASAPAVQPEMPELFFCPDLKGYGWCFRKGEFLNVGLGRVDPRQLSSHLSGFSDFLRRRGKIEGNGHHRFHGHAYQLYQRAAPQLVADGLLLVGDAAGLAYPQSGEGIRPAVESGLMAADVILSGAGRYGRDDLRAYARRVVDRLGEPRRLMAGPWLPGWCLSSIATGLLNSRWFARRIVMDRWFLHAAEPILRLEHPLG